MNQDHNPQSSEHIDQRLIELEIKASFNEDWLEQINQTILGNKNKLML